MASFSFLQWCLIISILYGSAFAQLSEKFYSNSCPKASHIVRNEVKKAIKKDPWIGAGLLNLHFHDCSVGGCDGSALLDDTKSSIGEKSALFNINSTTGYEVIDKIKVRLEKKCPRVVSCADILAMTAQAVVVRHEGPCWKVPLGRRDSTKAYRDLADALIQFHSTPDAILKSFLSQGLTLNEFVALQGSHTIGHSKCKNFRHRVYNDTNIDTAFAKSLRANCPKEGGDYNTSPIDYTTPFVFDNAYFVNLMKKKGLLKTDQALYNGTGGVTDAIVSNYSSSQEIFFKAYVTAIIKYGKLGVLTGKDGEIRTNCRKVNGANVWH